MKHLAPNQITDAPQSFEAPLSVTLSLQDWLCLQTNMGFAVHVLKDTGSVSTAQVLEETLSRLRSQTAPAIEAAADQNDFLEAAE